MNARQVESLLWAGIAVGVLYFVRQFQEKLELGLDVAGRVYETARFNTANIIETFFPLTNSNQFITHAVTFPNGERHAVPGEWVDPEGYFDYHGIRYRMMVNPKSGQKIALTT
jgi:hypothetical protein